MKPQKDDVRHGADRKHILPEEAGSLIAPAAAYRVKIRGGPPNGRAAKKAVRHVKDISERALIALQTQEHIHQDGPVPPAAQGPADAAAGDQGNLALGGKSTGQNHNLHEKSPPSRLSRNAAALRAVTIQA